MIIINYIVDAIPATISGSELSPIITETKVKLYSIIQEEEKDSNFFKTISETMAKEVITKENESNFGFFSINFR